VQRIAAPERDRRYPASVAYDLVTDRSERDRCCVVIDEVRCEQPSAVRIADAERSWDGYTYTCLAHADLVLADVPGGTVERVER
jgi:hypothetical protein